MKMQLTALLQRAATSSVRINCAGVSRAIVATNAAVKTQSAVRARTSAAQSVRFISSTHSRMHNDDHDHVTLGGKLAVGAHRDHDHDHDHDHDDEDDHDDGDEEDMEDVVDIGPLGKEFGGPQRGGKFKEPTRFGDWERKGRCTDF